MLVVGSSIVRLDGRLVLARALYCYSPLAASWCVALRLSSGWLAAGVRGVLAATWLIALSREKNQFLFFRVVF